MTNETAVTAEVRPATVRMLVHPGTGDRLVILADTVATGGASFRFEILTRGPRPAAEPPVDHVHPQQEERVEVLAGALRCRIAGTVRVLRPGDAIKIPQGTPHAVWSTVPGETRAIGEFRPALDVQARLEAYFRGVGAARWRGVL
jgi:mannose-6-phosphate isomerase-like protein (cupin superfamily)